MTAATTRLTGHEIAERIEGLVPGAVEETGLAWAWVRPERLVDVCRALRDDPKTDARFLNNISGVDRYDHFEVVYHLTSFSHNHELSLKVRTDHEAPEVASVVSVWYGAHLQEREVYDLMGIWFAGHPQLKRLLLWEGFPGHPLRKDYLTLPGGVKPGLQRFPKEDPEQWGGEFRAD